MDGRSNRPAHNVSQTERPVRSQSCDGHIEVVVIGNPSGLVPLGFLHPWLSQQENSGHYSCWH